MDVRSYPYHLPRSRAEGVKVEAKASQWTTQHALSRPGRLAWLACCYDTLHLVLQLTSTKTGHANRLSLDARDLDSRNQTFNLSLSAPVPGGAVNWGPELTHV